MEYKKLKEQLLYQRVLTKEQAEEILAYWRKEPQKYSAFLRNSGMSEPLRAYAGVNEEDDKGHYFIPIQVKVPSLEIAEKFFKTNDDEVIIDFLTLVNNLSAENLDKICAWPFLSMVCIQHLDRQILKGIISDGRYVFDFQNDRRGELFDKIYKMMADDFHRRIFAANSFNVFGWLHQIHKYQIEQVGRYFLLAEHATGPDSEIEAFARKIYINYSIDVENLTEVLARKLQPSQAN